jgi:hypothetical protein
LGERLGPDGSRITIIFNRLRSDLFGMLHVCYVPITTKFRIAAE